jgi:Secretion system C-terminal sorting domain
MRLFLLASILLLNLWPASVSAQVTNLEATDCNSLSRNVHDPLNQGKVLVLLFKGWDCGICQGSAPSWDAFADTADTNIEVWCALSQLYGAGSSSCSNITTWNTNYGFDNIWTFSPDAQGTANLQAWENQFCAGSPCNAMPKYSVINPANKTVAYYGSNATTARSTANQLSETTSLVNSDVHKLQLSVFPNPAVNRLTLAGLQQYTGELRIQVMDANGRIVLTQMEVLAGEANLELAFVLPSGLYTIVANQSDRRFIQRIVVQ